MTDCVCGHSLAQHAIGAKHAEPCRVASCDCHQYVTAEQLAEMARVHEKVEGEIATRRAADGDRLAT